MLTDLLIGPDAARRHDGAGWTWLCWDAMVRVIRVGRAAAEPPLAWRSAGNAVKLVFADPMTDLGLTRIVSGDVRGRLRFRSATG